jgi:hypothetical protein
MDLSKNLLSIGMFAEMTRLSIKALRLYNEVDLLKPLHIDRSLAIGTMALTNSRARA